MLYDSLRDGIFPELTLRGLSTKAAAMVRRGGKEALEGHVLLGAVAPITADRDGLIEHFSEASRMAPSDPFAWLNDAAFSPKVGLVGRAAEIIAAHRNDGDGNPSMLRVLLECALACGLVYTAQGLTEKLENMSEKIGTSDFPAAPLRDFLAHKGLDEMALATRIAVAADAAFQVTRRPILGFSLKGSTSMGYCYQFMFADRLALPDADEAIAEAMTSSFDDDFSEFITFSTTSCK